MTQLDLLKPYVPTGRTDTSLQAALNIRGKAQSIYFEVYLTLRQFGPMTDEQIQQRLPRRNPTTVRVRRVGLTHEGKVVDSGLRKRNAAGRQMIVWRAV